MSRSHHHKKIFNHGVGKYVRGVVPTMPPRKTMCSLSYRHHAHTTCSHTTFFVCVCVRALVYLCSYRSLLLLQSASLHASPPASQPCCQPTRQQGTRPQATRPPTTCHQTHTTSLTWPKKHTFGVQRAPAPMCDACSQKRNTSSDSAKLVGL